MSYSIRKVFLQILKNSLVTTCVGVSSLIREEYTIGRFVLNTHLKKKTKTTIFDFYG